VIILDTNVVSEPLKPVPAVSVLAWLDRQSPETLFLTALNVAELLDGIGRLPEGRRKRDLHDAMQSKVLPLFAGRVLPFDDAAAASFALIQARAREAGLGVGMADACIAAIAHSRGFVVATRDTAPFVAAGVGVIDPWAA
jgi:predicted nucleic acid-binding protein